MIVGIGIDMIECHRVGANINADRGFVDKVFSPAEVAYCKKMAQPDQHFAARFAAKEAFLKAAGGGLALGHDLNLIEVVHNDNGMPSLKLSGNFALLSSERGWGTIHLSLSHVQAMACAVVIIEKDV